MFYKRENDTLLSGLTVQGPGFKLTPENRTEHTYPVEGWTWFDSLDDAMRALVNQGNTVTMRQARLALLGAGLLTHVDAAIAAIPDPVQRTAAQIEWEYATVIERNSLLVQSLAAGLGLTAPAIDALFEAASRI